MNYSLNPQTNTMKLLLFLWLLCWLMVMCSCSKTQWEEKPTCQRVFMYSDKYNSDTIYLRTDTLHPFKEYENYLCDLELLKWRNQKPVLQGCERDGFEMYRYRVGNELSKPIFFNQ